VLNIIITMSTNNQQQTFVSITKKWGLGGSSDGAGNTSQPEARVCVGFHHAPQMLIVSAPLHEIKFIEGNLEQSNDSKSIRVEYADMPLFKEGFMEALESWKTNKTVEVLKPASDMVGQFRFYCEDNYQMHITVVVTMSQQPSSHTLGNVDPGVYLSSGQCKKLKSYFKYVEEQVEILAQHAPVFDAMFTTIAQYVRQFECTKEILAANAYSGYDEFKRYESDVHEAVQTAIQLITRWGLHTDVVKNCTTTLDLSNIKSQISLNSIFHYCFALKHIWITYYMGLNHIEMEMEEAAKNKRPVVMATPMRPAPHHRQPRQSSFGGIVYRGGGKFCP